MSSKPELFHLCNPHKVKKNREMKMTMPCVKKKQMKRMKEEENNNIPSVLDDVDIDEDLDELPY